MIYRIAEKFNKLPSEVEKETIEWIEIIKYIMFKDQQKELEQNNQKNIKDKIKSRL